MRVLLPLSAVFFFSGCLGGPSGVWMIQYTPTETDEDPCATTGTENFENGAFPEEEVGTVEGDWVYTETQTYSDVLLFVQIETSASGEAVLLMGTSAYPGTSDGGVWTFAWDATESETSSAAHADGYLYSESASATLSTSFRIEPKGDTASGSVTSSGSQEVVYTESDEWDPDQNDVYDGQIPSDAYLENEDGPPPRNAPDEDDCTGDTCQIAVATECSGSQSFTATRTDYADEDAYDYLMGAGQGGGGY